MGLARDVSSAVKARLSALRQKKAREGVRRIGISNIFANFGGDQKALKRELIKYWKATGGRGPSGEGN